MKPKISHGFQRLFGVFKIAIEESIRTVCPHK
jgi:hypothetical protein